MTKSYTRSEKLREYEQQRRINSLTSESGIETDPIYSASVAATITAEDKDQWETAYGWGDHSGLYAPVAHVGATGAAHGVATTLANGFMSSTDKTKLDGVESGAQVNSVSSVFTRTGAVVAASGDYTATQVTNTPAGNIAATTVQAAINELDSEKQPLNPTLTAISDGSLGAFGHRNKIINGKMEIAQRGTSFPAIASGSYSVDRWRLGNATSSAVVTASQQPDAPANSEFNKSLRIAVTTTDTSIISAEYVIIDQLIEGLNVRDLVGRPFTASFWVRSSKTGTHCFVCRHVGSDKTYVNEYTINAANTWEHKSVSIPGLNSTGSWDTSTEVIVRFTLAAGPTYHTTPGTWNTGSLLATTNQVNCLDTVGNIFAITGVQLEAGSVATPFEHRPYGTELALCQRYYELVTPVRLTGLTYTPNGDTRSFYPFAVTKRAAPTMSSSGSLFIIAVGSESSAVNVDIGTVSVGASTHGWGISGVSGYAALSSCGAVVQWGDSASALVVRASCEL